MTTETEFLAQLQSAIRDNRITLPTLPEVALRVRDEVDREETTASRIADMVATDAALSTRLLQVANSPLYRARVAIDNIQMAVTRLGLKLVRSLVISLAMKQIFQATSDLLDKRLRTLWEESVQVAAFSRILAQSLPRLDKEQAMLAGLIHNIGSLPILTLAESYAEFMCDEERLDNLVFNLSPIISKQILEAWDFPETLIRVAENYQNLNYDGGPEADYVDVVLVARLQTLSDHHQAGWSQVKSFQKVGIEPEIEMIEIEGVAEDMEGIRAVFL
jgi:HD-like signal output (HDOD) protein